MVGTFPTGWHVLHCAGTANGVYYPDPFEKDATPPAASWFMTNTGTNSPFSTGGRVAVIRSVFFHRDNLALGPLVALKNHTGTKQFWLAATHPDNDIFFQPDWLIPGGFRIDITGGPTLTIAYEINGAD